MKPTEPVVTDFDVLADEDIRAVLAATAATLQIPPLNPASPTLSATQAVNCVKIHVRDVWVRQKIGEWRALLRIVPSKHGHPVVAEIRMFPFESDLPYRPDGLRVGEWSGCCLGDRAVVPGSGLTARLLHKIKVGAAVSAGRGFLRQQFDTKPRNAELAAFWICRPAAQPKHGGRRRIPDEVVVRLAAVYARDFESPNPVEVAAKTCHISRTQARDWLHLARKRGILCPADSTRPHGELTPKGMEMLKAIKARAATKPPVQTKGAKRP